MNVLALQFNADVIAAKTQTVAAYLCKRSKNIREPNFRGIAGRDVGLLFHLYDEQFFDGWLSQKVVTGSPTPMQFRVSSRMTRAGGKTTRRRIKPESRYDYEIAIASRLLFLSFGEIDRPIRIGGLICSNRLDAMQRIMEHEIIHLVEMLQWDESSCNQPRFKGLIRNIFGHTEVRHELITPREDAAVRHQVRVGVMVRFEFEGEQHIGRVNRIHHRATVLVESKQGPKYSDGKQYAKYYVPVQQLQTVNL